MDPTLLQIVPMLPPALSGVGDYALLLARELSASHGMQTHFLHGDPTWQSEDDGTSSYPIRKVSERSMGAMLRALEQEPLCRTVLLHYVGYGYARRGCPFWLVRALERWKQRTGGRLIVLFHEVTGSGPIWTSGFWTAPWQDWLAGRLARLVDAQRITTEFAAARLRAMLPGARRAARTLAVFSTVGEPLALVPYSQRQRQMVVFGSSGLRRRAYTTHLPDLARACQQLRIERIVDIGAPTGVRPVLPVPFVGAGVLAAHEASALLGESTAGFFTYPVVHMGKSTVFAAYCAHGLTPVTFPGNAERGDEALRAHEHFLMPAATDAAPDEQRLAQVAVAAHAWYQPHRLAVHAAEIHRTVLDLTPC